MKFAMTAVGLALALGSTSATAQLAKQATEREKQEQQGPQGGATITVGDRKLTITPRAAKQIQELQAAVNANDVANIPAKLAAAKAAAATADERYIVAKLQLQAAVASKNDAALVEAMEALLATGHAPRQEALVLHQNLANAHLKANRHQQAAAALQRVIELDPANTQAKETLAALYAQTGRADESLAMIEQQLAASRASGATPSETLYKSAVAAAYKARLPKTIDLSREWVKAYPTSANWRDALGIYQNLTQLDETRKLDLLRLKRVAGALTPGDYFDYADIAVRKGFAGEAKAVLDEGFAASAIKRESNFNELYTLASQRARGDRESLPASPSAGNARQTLNTGDAYFGYGDYAKAVQFYRAALSQPGADRDLINLHLGMALARQGDKAGATAAFNAVGGTNAALAQYWALYLSTRA